MDFRDINLDGVNIQDVDNSPALPTPEPDVVAVVPRRGRGRPVGSKDSYQRTRRKGNKKKNKKSNNNVEAAASTYYKYDEVSISRAECNSIRSDVKRAMLTSQSNYVNSLDHRSSINV